jgi:hypothetical protein
MGQVRHKTNQFRASPVSGVRRSSQFASWSPYNDLGQLCTEDNLGTVNSWTGHHWSGGGAWFLTRDTHSFNPPKVDMNTGLIQGPVRMGSNLSGVTQPSLPVQPSDSQANALGATAIARTEPTNPAFDLSVTLGELMREGIPNAPGSSAMERTKAAKSAGGEYLNIEFGWLPLVRSINDFATVVRDHDDIIRKYQEGANRTIKRSYQWEPEQAYGYSATNFGAVPANGNFTGGGRYTSTSKTMWFEVDYQYYLPTGGSTNDKIRRFGSYARKLLGVRLTPEVLWNLAPWSWAADWVANTGDVIHNISAIGTDGLVIRNGYIMCHTQRITVDHGRFNGTGPDCFHTRVEESKTRRPATPYGFGTSYDGLSNRKKAILVALGMSRW